MFLLYNMLHMDAKKVFQDTDLNKVNGAEVQYADLLSMGLEPLKETDAKPSTAMPDQPATTPAAPTTPVDSAPTVPPQAPTEPVTPTPEAAPASVVDEILSSPNSPTESDDDVLKKLEQVLFETDDVAEAAKKLEEATKKGEWVAEAKKEFDDEKKALIDQIDQWKKLAMGYKDQASKAESEKNLADVELSRMGKIYELVMDDEGLKSLVAYKKKSEEDPSYKSKLVDAARDFYEGISGQSIGDLVAWAKKEQKKALWGGWDFSTPASPDEGGKLLWGLLEPLR